MFKLVPLLLLTSNFVTQKLLKRAMLGGTRARTRSNHDGFQTWADTARHPHGLFGILHCTGPPPPCILSALSSRSTTFHPPRQPLHLHSHYHHPLTLPSPLLLPPLPTHLDSHVHDGLAVPWRLLRPRSRRAPSRHEGLLRRR